MESIENYNNYAFVFAHPDDEVYCCGLMNRLVASGKAVSAIFLTSGDAGVNAHIREGEVADSMQHIGIAAAQTHLLRFPEKTVLSNLAELVSHLAHIIKTIQPDCIVGMDFEGGHEVHDAVSFATSHCLKSHPAAHYVFPVYHSENGHRVAADFRPTHNATDSVQLAEAETDVKIRVLEAHRGQIGHFLHLQRLDPHYFERLFTREVYRRIESSIDYTVRPWQEIGYESHRNGFKFRDFEAAIRPFSG